MRNAIVLTAIADTSEIRSLLSTLEVRVVREFLQKRSAPHLVSYLGPGKIEEILKQIEGDDVDLVVVNGNLKPSQHHYLEMKFQTECVDRFGIILQIFTEHAQTPEAIAQVRLAKFRYELPFLREWIHKAKSGDRPGFLSGGAYATDVYYEYARKQVKRVEGYLDKISREREIVRAKRRSKGYTLVCLSGYTNAGKSSLLNSLCASSVQTDNRMFSTLSTTTRRLLDIKGNILLTDTVGFIRDLPPDLVDAFKSTLEEIFYADIILLVLDASENRDTITSKLGVSMDILLPRMENRSLIVVANKADEVEHDNRHDILAMISQAARPYPVVFVSSLTGDGLDELRKAIFDCIDTSCRITAELKLTSEAYSLISDLHSKAFVTSQVSGDKLNVEINCRPEDRDLIVSRIRPLAMGEVRITNTQGNAG